MKIPLNLNPAGRCKMNPYSDLASVLKVLDLVFMSLLILGLWKSIDIVIALVVYLKNLKKPKNP